MAEGARPSERNQPGTEEGASCPSCGKAVAAADTKVCPICHRRVCIACLRPYGHHMRVCEECALAEW